MTIIALLVSSLFFTNIQRELTPWHGLVPLRTTRADVEKLLGAPLSSCRCDYRTPTERVFIVYADGPCVGNSTRWRVPKNTIISITIRPVTPRKLADLNLRKFTKTNDPELVGYAVYENEEIGVSYSVSNKREVYAINWFASVGDDRILRCCPSQ